MWAFNWGKFQVLEISGGLGFRTIRIRIRRYNSRKIPKYFSKIKRVWSCYIFSVDFFCTQVIPYNSNIFFLTVLIVLIKKYSKNDQYYLKLHLNWTINTYKTVLFLIVNILLRYHKCSFKIYKYEVLLDRVEKFKKHY